MKYTLDTNTCIRAINGRVPRIRERLLQIPALDIVVCSIVRSELFYGSAKSQTPLRSRQKQDLFHPIRAYHLMTMLHRFMGKYGQP